MLAEEIGLKWAKRIAIAFEEWAEQEKKSRTIEIKPFDPTPLIKGTFYDASDAQLSEIGKLIGMGVKFDLRSKEAEAWCKAYGAKEVRYINAGTRAAIRQISLRSLQDGLTPAETAKEIKKIIGLHPNHVLAVRNYKDVLLKSGMDESAVQRLSDKYANKLLRFRANTIGLTESHTATNMGAIQATEEATNRGIISKRDYQLEWLYTSDGRVCEKCSSYNGMRASIGDKFPNGLSAPPAHPRCRCTTIIVNK